MGKCKTKTIQTNLGTFRHNQAYSKPEAYSDIYDKAFCENSWRKIVPQYKFAALSTSRNIYHEVVTPERVILCKKKQKKPKQTN